MLQATRWRPMARRHYRSTAVALIARSKTYRTHCGNRTFGIHGFRKIWSSKSVW